MKRNYSGCVYTGLMLNNHDVYVLTELAKFDKYE